MWRTNSDELVDSIRTAESSNVGVAAYWVLRGTISSVLDRAEKMQFDSPRAQWVLEDCIEHLYGAKDALFNVAVFGRSQDKTEEKIKEIQEHVRTMQDMLAALEDMYGNTPKG